MGDEKRDVQVSPEISSFVDPTGVMPAFDTGRKPVAELTFDEVQSEWRLLASDKPGEHDNWPDSVRLQRLNELSRRLSREKWTPEAEAKLKRSEEAFRERLEEIKDRDHDEDIAKARAELDKIYGSRENSQKVVETVIRFMREVSGSSRVYGELQEFLGSTYAKRGKERVLLGNSPRLIQLAYQASRNPGLQAHIRAIGPINYIKLKAAELGWKLEEDE